MDITVDKQKYEQLLAEHEAMSNMLQLFELREEYKCKGIEEKKCDKCTKYFIRRRQCVSCLTPEQFKKYL